MARLDYFHVVSLWILLTVTLCKCTAKPNNRLEEARVVQENVIDPQVPTGQNITERVVPVENVIDPRIVTEKNVTDSQVALLENVIDKNVTDPRVAMDQNATDPRIGMDQTDPQVENVIDPPVAMDQNVIYPRVATNGFIAGLVRADVDSAGQEITKSERLRRAIERSQGRLRTFQTLKDVDTPVHIGSGGYLMQVAMGSPAVTYNAVMDTGSELVWTQCDPCTKCYNQPDQIFDPSKSKTYQKVPCSSRFCQLLPSAECKSDCEYVYKYADESFTRGVLSYETFLFTGTDGRNMSFPRVAFGCGHDNEGAGFSQGSGIVGMGRGPLSLISQMGERAGNKFSYCLVSIDDPASKTSPLLFGTAAEFDGPGVKSTPFVQNEVLPHLYYLNLEGISVGGFPLDIPEGTFDVRPDGSGGIIIDSGTTITFLEEGGYRLLKRAVEGFVTLEKADGSGIGLDLCYKLPGAPFLAIVPAITFHFAGGADFELPSHNAFVADEESGLLCLAIAGSRDISIFGNIQQQNFHILYDLAENNLRFVPTNCDDLR